MLLADIRSIFDAIAEDKMTTTALLDKLKEIETSPWADWNKGKGLTPNGLSRLLKPFEVSPRAVKVENKTLRGYLRNSLSDAWQRYLPPVAVPAPSHRGPPAATPPQHACLLNGTENTIHAESSVPAVSQHLVKNFPQFDLNIPDQFRVDLWVQDFKADVKAGTVPALSILWVMDDHTGGPPTPDAEQADNDLAIGRIIDYISHSNVWSSSAIFIEEDDAQNGVDHVDGHRSPGYVVSPYVVQTGKTDHTYYTQVNMTRTIEQILGLTPMNQYDLVASPMRTAFVKGQPPAANFLPWTHVRNQVPLDQGVSANSPNTDSQKVKALRAAWLQKKAEIFAGKLTKPDSEDPEAVNHLNWYMSTGFKRPYPGERTVRSPQEFNKPAPDGDDD